MKESGDELKKDFGKPRYDLIPAKPLHELAMVYTMGAAKYKDRGWEAGMAWSRIFGAIMRHLWAFWRGEELDKESGLPHVTHAAWGCLALSEYMMMKRSFDDRPHPSNPGEVFEIDKSWRPGSDYGIPGKVWVCTEESLHPNPNRPGPNPLL